MTTQPETTQPETTQPTVPAPTGPPADAGTPPSPSFAIWSTGDYGVIARLVSSIGEHLVEAVDLRTHERVLDVAAGTGNASVPAARCGAQVLATDVVDALLGTAAARAAAEGTTLRTQVADAAALPFPDGSFDVAMSAIGVMFAPDQQACADELVRVVRPGGRIALASWTPDSLLAQQFALTARYAPPPVGAPSPFRWGSTDGLRELFGDRVVWTTATRRVNRFRHASARAYTEVFRDTYGPTMKALGRMDEAAQQSFLDELTDLVASVDVAVGGSTAVDGSYFEVVGVRR